MNIDDELKRRLLDSPPPVPHPSLKELRAMSLETLLYLFEHNAWPTTVSLLELLQNREGGLTAEIERLHETISELGKLALMVHEGKENALERVRQLTEALAARGGKP